MIQSVNTIDEDDLNALLQKFVPDEKMREKLAEFRLESNVAKGKYAGIPVEIDVRVTPRG